MEKLTKLRILQGAVLGPLLFLLFISDMPDDDIVSSVKIFANATKAFKDVQTKDDMLILQKDVDSLCDWSLKWQPISKATKCWLH